VTEWVKGKTLDQALDIKNTQIAEELALPPVKIHCSILKAAAEKTRSRPPCRLQESCSGMAYKLEFADAANPEDIEFLSHGVKVLVDPKSLPYLAGTELDYAREGLNEGFKFNNPNVKDACGCGESFNT
jgi:iron-sulfur cluster assembly accessory protein